MADTPDDFDPQEADGGALTADALDALTAAADAEAAAQEAPAMEEPAAPEQRDAFSAAAPSPFASLGASSGGASADADAPGLARVRDIPLEVTVELGRTHLLIKDILDLNAGSIIELDKVAGEPVDLFANGLLVARGEVVVIDDNFGVRVTEIITAADRSAPEETRKDARGEPHALAA